MGDASAAVGDLCFDFENMPVRLIATKKIQRMETSGIVVEETEPNRELTANLWIAWELVESGLARFADGGLAGEEWTQIHYRERLLPVGQPSPLPDGFYPRAYLTFNRMSREAGSDATRTVNLNRIRGMFRDILESRISKIARLASAEAASPSREFQPEEAALYAALKEAVSSWRGELRRLEGR